MQIQVIQEMIQLFNFSLQGGSTGGASVGLSLGYHISKSFYFGVNSFPQYQSAEFNTFSNDNLSPSTQTPISGSIVKTSIFTDSEKLNEIGFQSKDYKQKGSSHIEVRISPTETSGFFFIRWRTLGCFRERNLVDTFWYS